MQTNFLTSIKVLHYDDVMYFYTWEKKHKPEVPVRPLWVSETAAILSFFYGCTP